MLVIHRIDIKNEDEANLLANANMRFAEAYGDSELFTAAVNAWVRCNPKRSSLMDIEVFLRTNHYVTPLAPVDPGFPPLIDFTLYCFCEKCKAVSESKHKSWSKEDLEYKEKAYSRYLSSLEQYSLVDPSYQAPSTKRQHLINDVVKNRVLLGFEPITC